MMIGLEENTACITMEQPPAKDYETLYAENEAPGIIPQLAQWHCCYNWFDCITLDVHNDDPENDSLIRRCACTCPPTPNSLNINIPAYLSA